MAYNKKLSVSPFNILAINLNNWAISLNGLSISANKMAYNKKL
jgi:hypothetical protein